MFKTIDYRVEGAVAIATVQRPEAMNAINAEVLADLSRVLDEVAASTTIRCMILTGAGEKAFVAGADIKRFDGLDPNGAEHLAVEGQRLLARMEALRQPVIAAVNGFALGGGLELALACDFIYAVKTAKMGLPECTLGLMPGFGGTVRLAKRIGPGRARELTYTGGMITAEQAQAMGLVNGVLEPSELMPACRKLAEQIASRAPIAIANIKKSIRHGLDVESEQAMQKEAQLFGELFATEDQKEGVRAFIEKRQAQFKGR